MTIYQRMLFSAGLLRAPEGQTGGGTTSVFSGGGAGGAGGDGGQQPQNNGDGGAGGSSDGGGQQQQAPDWFTKLAGDPDMKAWAESKGWKDPATADPFAIAQSYHNLEKLFGADKAGRTIVLPKDENDKAALDAIYDRLGRPKEAKDYEINAPEGADPAFVETAKGWYHKAGLTKAQAAAVTESYKAAELDAVQKVQTAHAQEVEGLQAEWKDKFDQNVETAKAAIKSAGLTEAHVKAIEAALGPASAAKMFEFFGRNYLEASPPGGDNRSAPSFQNMNPAQAAQKMEQLRADPAFMERYSHPDPKIRAAAMDEMDKLAQLAVNAKAG